MHFSVHNFEWKISRFLEPSFCLLGGSITIGLGFAILAAPPLILTPSPAQVQGGFFTGPS